MIWRLVCDDAYRLRSFHLISSRLREGDRHEERQVEGETRTTDRGRERWAAIQRKKDTQTWGRERRLKRKTLV